MAADPKNGQSANKRPPAKTPEEQENRMISLAMNLAEKQLIDGTASSTTISHYLKLASTREQEEMKKLKAEVKLLEARETQVGSQEETKKMYAEAMAAFKVYSGHDAEEEHPHEDENF